MDKESKMRFRKKAQALSPSVIIGKNLVNDSLLGELNDHLRRRGLVKVKMQHSARHEADVEDMARELVEKTGAEIVETRGGTIVLYKKPLYEKTHSRGAT